MAKTDSDRLKRIVSEVCNARARVKRHGDYMAHHETRTRASLIDPLLGSIGWDLKDPNRVKLEKPVEGGTPDYVQFSDEVLEVVVEAKSLHDDLSRSDNQLFAYMLPPSWPAQR